MSNHTNPARVLSGMRPTGKLHLGHYHGVLKNWVKLQYDYESFFFVADWHALTTHYDAPATMGEHVWDMVIDWLAAGVDPDKATLFIQSKVPEHAELALMLSMLTPLSWLLRVPSFKDQQARLKDRDLATHGFLGYPLLQSADILMYKAAYVPVGEDQVPHVEITREIARRFNHFYGREPNYENLNEAAISKMGKKVAKHYRQLRQDYTERGDKHALEQATELLSKQQNLNDNDKQRLLGYLEGGGRSILPEPEALLTSSAKMPGLDGAKMSKSYNNAIYMRDDQKRVASALRTMPTDPARQRRTDRGDPQKCPVWQLHQVYTDKKTHEWLTDGCTTASIGCVDCKQPLIDAVLTEQRAIAERAEPYINNHAEVKQIVAKGSERASVVAKQTMQTVREAMGLDYT